MKRTIFKMIASVFTFVLTIYLSSLVMNRGNVNTTRYMERATLPVVYMNVDGEYINELCGYTSPMNEALLRENITPLDESRGVSFRVSKYGQLINKITVKVRTVDGNRLVESIDITEYEEDDYGINISVTLKDLLDEYVEYSLEIVLTMWDGKDIIYHTRIIEADNYMTKEKLAFVKNFLQKEMQLETNAELKEYMESNYLGDNTTLSNVGIHSSMAQLAFGDLNVKRENDPVISIKEIASETGTFLVNYIVSTTENGIKTKYFVEEYYRIKYTPKTIYLLDYNRTMEQIPDEENTLIRNKDIYFGITDLSNLQIIESVDGNVFAFETANRLFSYNISANKLVNLFGFYDFENFDARTYRKDHMVKPLYIDEAGNAWYLVGGYMNRGTYEGRVGLALYYFNGVTSITTEKFFINSDKSAEMVMRDLNELSYISKDGLFYFMMDSNIYVIDVENETTEILVSNLQENRYTVSDDSNMMVWQVGDDVNACETLMLMNLNTKQINEIKAPEGKYIKPLAFAGDDIIYGLAYKEDVVTDKAGRTTFPMHLMKIQNKYGENLKEYSQEGLYVTQASVDGNLITLQRVKKSEKEENVYIAAPNDYITNNQERTELVNEPSTYTNGAYEKTARIWLKKEPKGKTVKILPQEEIYEGTNLLELEKPESSLKYYYAYYNGKLKGVYTNPANAVNAANTNFGTVLNEEGNYVWYRANRDLRNQIMNLTLDGVSKEEQRSNLAVCLDNMLEYSGVVRNSSYLLNRNQTILSILEDGLEDSDILDLTGCELDAMLYYVNRDIPVLALVDAEHTYLVIGFNSLAIVLYDPEKGTYKVGMNEAKKMFEDSGNQFITYIPN